MVGKKGSVIPGVFGKTSSKTMIACDFGPEVRQVPNHCCPKSDSGGLPACGKH